MHYVPYAVEEDMRAARRRAGAYHIIMVVMVEFRTVGARGELGFGVYLHLPYISISRISLPRLEHCACSQPCTVCAPLSRIFTTCPVSSP
jgi:hypothetical protein